jgi:L,D-transpeptidase YcbB
MTRLGMIVPKLRGLFATLLLQARKGGLAMPCVRLDRFLASTAIIALLTATAGGALTEPMSGIDVGATTPPAAAAVPATKNEPAAAVGGDEIPTAAPPATRPGEPVAAPPAGTLAEADAAIAEQMRNLANGKFDHIIGNKNDRTTIDAFYSGRHYAPLWISDGKANSRAKAAIAYLGRVYADGLDPVDYPVPDFAAFTDPAALAEAEIRLTTSVTAYVHHAQVGRIHWSRVSGDIFYDQKPPDPADILASLMEAKDVREALAAYEPRFPAYLALKAKLAEVRVGKIDIGEQRIPNGPTLKVGMQDERVPQLRERLRVSGDGGTTYDKVLAGAVKQFQQQHDIKPTGALTLATIDALNDLQRERPADTIIANMERWRWLPRDLGKTYVMVNLPDFTLRVIDDGKLVWMTKIVAGKPATPTPIMSAEMKYITVNPTWNVPPSIAANEYLPLLQQDPTILERMGLRVSYNPDGSIHLSQPPGDQNALGRLRFNFPNKFLVYQHDSNQKYLFANDRRAESHGCMRVQDPLKYAEVLLLLVRPGEGYTQDRIRKMFGNNETNIQFPTFIPVHLTYQTAFVDDQGKLEFREDIYGRDRALLAILNGDERKIADIPIERKDNMARRQALAMSDQFWGAWGWGRRGYYAGNFFARLFGGPFAQSPPIPPRPFGQRRPYQ